MENDTFTDEMALEMFGITDTTEGFTSLQDRITDILTSRVLVRTELEWRLAEGDYATEHVIVEKYLDYVQQVRDTGHVDVAQELMVGWLALSQVTDEELEALSEMVTS